MSKAGAQEGQSESASLQMMKTCMIGSNKKSERENVCVRVRVTRAILCAHVHACVRTRACACVCDRQREEEWRRRVSQGSVHRVG